MNMEITKNDMASITKNNLDTIEACRYCPMCRQACPSEFISYRESDTPRGRAMLLYSVCKAGKEYDEATIEAIFNCFVCGSCKSWCLGFEEGGYNIPELIKFARKDIVQRGKSPKIIEAIKTSLLDKDNPYNIEKSASFSNAIEDKKADVLYYMGAEINFRNSEIAKAIIKIFNQLKVSYGLLKNEPSSGKILDLLGYCDDAMGKAKHLYQRILDSGCKIVVVSDPLDYDAFKNDYPEWGFKFDPDIKILHLTEYLADFIKSGSLKLGKTKERITLADSEFLGHFNNVFEAPREIIKSSAGANFVEMQWNHEELKSTGEAAFTYNDQMFTQGAKLGEKISIMAKDIHAERIITLSATAKNNIGKGVDIVAIDIAEFIADLM
jgi:Fe-S oxidoreductase